MSPTTSPETTFFAMAGSNVLLLAPSLSEEDEHSCLDLLDTGDPGSTRLLIVSITGSPGERLRGYVEAKGEPREAAEICGGRRNGSVPDGGDGVSVTSIENPGDLTRIGIEIDKALAEWEDEEGSIAVCFHSLTPLLQYVDLQTLFRFLHILTSRFRDAGAEAHFHMDPEAHDGKTISIIRSLFDEVETTAKAAVEGSQ